MRLRAGRRVVDADHPGRASLAEPERGRRILRVDRRGQAVAVPVRQVDGLVERVPRPGAGSPTNPSRGLAAVIRPVPVEPSTVWWAWTMSSHLAKFVR